MPNKAIWSTGYKPIAADLKGLYKYEYETEKGLVIECHLEYEKAERATYDEPGCAASIELVWALVEGVDIAEVLGFDLVATIEEKALENMEEAADDSLADAAADRWEDARCEA